MRQVTINVTREDIREGERARNQSKSWDITNHCPVARAATRALAAPASVGSNTLFLREEGSCATRYMALLPEVAVDWIKSFDYRFPVGPFTFDVTIVE